MTGDSRRATVQPDIHTLSQENFHFLLRKFRINWNLKDSWFRLFFKSGLTYPFCLPKWRKNHQWPHYIKNDTDRLCRIYHKAHKASGDTYSTIVPASTFCPMLVNNVRHIIGFCFWSQNTFVTFSGAYIFDRYWRLWPS